jgi:hypothetical protein
MPVLLFGELDHVDPRATGALTDRACRNRTKAENAEKVRSTYRFGKDRVTIHHLMLLLRTSGSAGFGI